MDFSSSYRSNASSERSINSVGDGSGEGGSYSLPPFPGKTMSRLTESQKEKRRLDLEAYLQALLKVCRNLLQNNMGREVVDVVESFLQIKAHVAPSLPVRSAKDDQQKYEQERKNKLMEASSVVSPTLIRVFFLDCTFRAVKYSESTTVKEIAEKMSPHLSVAMFEVESDVRVASQLRILRDDTYVATVVQQWEEAGFERSKFVIPVYNMDETLVSGGKQRVRSAAPMRERNFSTIPSSNGGSSVAVSSGGKSMIGVPSLTSVRSTDMYQSVMGNSVVSSPTQNSGHEGMDSSYLMSSPGSLHSALPGGESTREVSGELKELREKFDKLQKKYDILRNILKKRGGRTEIARTPGGGTETRKTRKGGAMAADQRQASPKVRERVPEESIVLCGWLEKLSDYKRVWNNRYFVLKESGDLSYYYNEPRGVNEDNKFCLNLKDVTRVVRSSRELAFTVVSESARVVLHAPWKSSFDEWFEGIQELRTHLVMGGAEAALGESDVKEEVDGGESEAKDKATDKVDVALDLVFDTDQFDMDNNRKVTARVFIDNVAMVDEFFYRFDSDYLTQTFNHAAVSPDHLTQAHELTSAMQVLYTNLLGYGERWSNMFRSWLLKSLKTHMTLPVQRPDLLMSVVQCLSNEHMLHAPETVKEVENAIESCLGGDLEGQGGVEEQGETDSNGRMWHNAVNDDLGGIGKGEKGREEGGEVEQLLRTVKSMIDSLFIVVDDLVPMLPPDFNVLSLFQKAVEERINQKVGVFYRNHKDNLDVDELLNLLSWADNHKHVMGRFGIHSLSQEFLAMESDLFTKYSQQVSNLQLQWQKRIMENENSHVVSSIHDGSKISSWPEDLIGCVGLQLQLAITRLQGDSIEKICCLCVGLLEDFQRQMAQKFEGDGGIDELSVERMCVFSNDCFRFADLLQDQGGLVDNLTPEAAEKVTDKISDIIMLFSSLSNVSLEGIVGVMCADIEDELKATIFGEREGGLGDLKEMLRSCGEDIKLWLCDHGLVGIVLKKSLHRIVKCYLEVLLDSKPKLDAGGGLMRQTKEDGEVFEGLFEEFEDIMPSYLMEREVRVEVRGDGRSEATT